MSASTWRRCSFLRGVLLAQRLHLRLIARQHRAAVLVVERLLADGALRGGDVGQRLALLLEGFRRWRAARLACS
jgi:hypothetical protein